MEGRKEGREGGKGKKEEGRKERLTLPKGNTLFSVLKFGLSFGARPLSLTFIKFFEQESS